MTSPSTETKPTIVEWLVDTRPLWPEAQATKDLEQYASRALSLLPDSVRVGVLKYYHLKDAKLSLISHLLKRHVLSSLLNIPWSQATPIADPNGKPVFPGIAFNVSHQAGIVGCIGIVYPASNPSTTVQVGIDIVSTTERRERDRKMIFQSGGGTKGFTKFVGVHNEVFGRGEMEMLLNSVVTGLLHMVPHGLDTTDKRLRAFYSLWCLREAYVKMTGEALLADWLGDLEFRKWLAPEPMGKDEFEFPTIPTTPTTPMTTGRNDDGDGVVASGSRTGSGSGRERGVLRNPEVWLHGEIEKTNIVLRSMGTGIMVSTAVRTPERNADGLSWELGRYKCLDLETILVHAENNP